MMAVTNEVLDAKITMTNELLKELKEDLKVMRRETRDSFATKETVNELDVRLKQLEDTTRWVIRIVIGSVIASILGLVLIK